MQLSNLFKANKLQLDPNIYMSQISAGPFARKTARWLEQTYDFELIYVTWCTRVSKWTRERISIARLQSSSLCQLVKIQYNVPEGWVLVCPGSNSCYRSRTHGFLRTGIALVFGSTSRRLIMAKFEDLVNSGNNSSFGLFISVNFGCSHSSTT